MKRLYHWPLDPAARAVRLVLAEKQESALLVESAPWSVHPDLHRLAPGAGTPTFVDHVSEGRVVLIGLHAALEHLEEAYPTPRLLPIGRQDRAEARRLWDWCVLEFSVVNEALLAERVTQWVRRDRQPDSAALRKGAHALRGRLTFLNALAEARTFIAGRAFTLADLVIAAQLSCLDYFGDIDWSTSPDLKSWYGRMKSRPGFRPLLQDRIEGVRPVKHYADLEF